MLEIKNLSCSYGNKDVLNDISLNLGSGDNLCVIGSNGCGKTTLLKTIAGQLKYKGSIKLLGKEISDYKSFELGREIATLSQIANVYFSFSVFDTVMLGRYVKLPKNAFAKIDKSHSDYVMYCLESVGIADLKDRQIDTLSGGQMQKVLLARALAQEPKIILLDEPSNHLDIKSQMELFTFIRQWSRDKEHSVIGVLHDIGLALNYFDKALFLRDGKIVFSGDLKSASQEDLEKTYNFDVVKYLTNLNKPLEEIANVQKQL